MSKLLLRGGCVLTMGVKTQNHAAADVLIDGETIAEIGQGLRARDAEVVDATDTIVMPGFVDTHRHACRALFRNLGASIPGSTPVSSASFGDHYTSDDVYAATLIGLLGAVEAGITTVVDRFDARTDVAAAEAALQAHTDSGLRTVFVYAARRETREGEPVPPTDPEQISRLTAAAGPTTTVAFGSVVPARRRSRRRGARVGACP